MTRGTERILVGVVVFAALVLLGFLMVDPNIGFAQ